MNAVTTFLIRRRRDATQNAQYRSRVDKGKRNDDKIKEIHSG